MNDADDRLRAADPARGATYQHHDLDAMLAHLVHQPRRATSSTWRHFRRRVWGSIAASALVTLGAVVALGGAGPGLAVLTLASPTPQDLSATAFGLKASAPAPLVTTRYTVAPHAAFATATPVATSYELVATRAPGAEARHLATLFGLPATAVVTHVSPATWIVKDHARLVLQQTPRGLWRWSYFVGAGFVLPVSQLPREHVLVTRARRTVERLGYGYGVRLLSYHAVPEHGRVTYVQGVRRSVIASGPETVRLRVVVGGLATDQSATVKFTPGGALYMASGPALAVASTVNYPLESAAQAVRPLVTTRAVTPLTSSTSSHVTFTAATFALGLYSERDGRLWLLPSYLFRGRRTTLAMVGPAQTLRVVALSPRYVRAAPAAG